MAAKTTDPNESFKAPMPEFLFRLMNPVMKWLLNSPFHRGMSKRLMVLNFTGRKSGKRYSTTVGYVRQGREIFVFTHSAWRANFAKPAAVKMRIEGNDVDGSAVLVSDPARLKEIIAVLSAANGEEMARRMGFWVENLESVGPAEIAQATRGTYFIQIETLDKK